VKRNNYVRRRGKNTRPTSSGARGPKATKKTGSDTLSRGETIRRRKERGLEAGKQKEKKKSKPEN